MRENKEKKDNYKNVAQFDVEKGVQNKTKKTCTYVDKAVEPAHTNVYSITCWLKFICQVVNEQHERAGG